MGSLWQHTHMSPRWKGCWGYVRKLGCLMIKRALMEYCTYGIVLAIMWFLRIQPVQAVLGLVFEWHDVLV